MGRTVWSTVFVSCAAVGLLASSLGRAQTFDAVLVQGQSIPAIYDSQAVDVAGSQLSFSAIAFASGNQLPPPLINAIQWTSPQQPPPNVSPPIYFYQVDAPQGTLNLSQLQIGNRFGAMGFIDGVIDLNPASGPATFLIPPQTPPGNVPNDPIQRGGQLGGPAAFQNTIIYHDPQQVPDGLRGTILVGLALPGTITGPRGMVTYGQADPQNEPTNPDALGGNGEFVWALCPIEPDPCIDESLLTEETLEYLMEQETAHGVTIQSETEVVNFQTVRDRIVSTTDADDGFTYVTIVEDFVTTSFYRFPTGTLDPKGFISPPGDVDFDGDVDGADLSVWQAGYGITGLAAGVNGDADGNDSVDGGDFLIWQRHVGIGLAAQSNVIAEPAALGTLLPALVMLGGWRGRKKNLRFSAERQSVELRNVVVANPVPSPSLRARRNCIRY